MQIISRFGNENLFGSGSSGLGNNLSNIEEKSWRNINPWTRWYDRMGSFFEEKFGPKWKEDEKEFWEKFPFY